MFGKIALKPEEIFVETTLSRGIVNLKPIFPGHVLVIPKRVIARVKDLTDAELTDLMILAKQVSIVIEGEYAAEAITMCIKDGAAAGQVIPHVHMHILPRRQGDFSNHETVLEERNIPKRSLEEMRVESEKLRKLMLSLQPTTV